MKHIIKANLGLSKLLFLVSTSFTPAVFAQCNQAGFVATQVFASTSPTLISNQSVGCQYYLICSGAGTVADSSANYCKEVFLNSGTNYILGNSWNPYSNTVYLKGNATLTISNNYNSGVTIYKEATATVINNSLQATLNTTICASITPPTTGGCTSVGLSTLYSQNSIVAYINEVTQTLHIEFPPLKQMCTIELLDVLGNVKLKKDMNTSTENLVVDILDSGIYFLTLKEKENVILCKKVIKR